MIRRPLGSNCAIRTVPSCPSSTETMRLLPACQSRAVRSSEAVTSLVPPGLNAAHKTAPSWPCRAASCCPLATSQSRALRSRGGHHLGPIGAERCPPDLVLVAVQHRQLLAARSVPQPCRAIIRGGHHLGPIGAEGRPADPPLVTAQLPALKRPAGENSSCLPLAACQSRAVRSSEEVTTLTPSGLTPPT